LADDLSNISKRELELTSSAIVQKLWNYCNVLRDDGMSYGDYVEQLTYLLFLKVLDEKVDELDLA
jgi:type I restriction enzyme M protein